MGCSHANRLRLNQMSKSDPPRQQPHFRGSGAPRGQPVAAVWGGAEREYFCHPRKFSQLALVWIQTLSLRIENFPIMRMTGVLKAISRSVLAKSNRRNYPILNSLCRTNVWRCPRTRKSNSPKKLLLLMLEHLSVHVEKPPTGTQVPPGLGQVLL